MKRKLLSLLAGPCMAVFMAAGLAGANDSIRVAKEQVRKKLDHSDVVIVDVRIGRDWKSSEFKITRAVRVPLREVIKLANEYSKDSTLIFYCA